MGLNLNTSTMLALWIQMRPVLEQGEITQQIITQIPRIHRVL